MTVWNYMGWAWIIWTLFNEGVAMMRRVPYRNASVGAGVVSSLLLSALAVWAALS